MTTFIPYAEWAERYFDEVYGLEADAMADEIVEALDAGESLPEDFEQLDTYAAAGEPGAVAQVARVRSRVADYYRDAGRPMPSTGTTLDRRARS